MIPWQSIEKDGYNLELVAMSTHTGTHIDAPYHFDSSRATLDRIHISRMFRRARLVRTKKRRGQNITVNEIKKYEQRTRTLAPDDTIIFETQWSSKLDSKYFDHSPGLEPAAARLLAKRNINMVGIDSPSIDPGDSESFVAHKILARSDTLIVENLCNLKSIRSDEFDIAIMPLKLEGVSGAPVRAVGMC